MDPKLIRGSKLTQLRDEVSDAQRLAKRREKDRIRWALKRTNPEVVAKRKERELKERRRYRESCLKRLVTPAQEQLQAFCLLPPLCEP